MTVATSLHLTGDGAAAEDVRRWMSRMVGDAQGVMAPTDLAVTETAGTPDMGVAVASGSCIIQGDEATYQGAYFLDNQASLAVSISAADPTNARKDLIVAKVQDSDYSGATDAGSIVVVTGTPAGSPAEPTVPDNAIVLALVDVAAAASSILDANITDRRTTTSGQSVVAAGSAGWIAWTPTLEAGGTGVTATVTHGRYRYVGTSTVHAQCFLAVTSAQSGEINVTLPVAASAADDTQIGTMTYYTNGTTTHHVGVAALTASGAEVLLYEAGSTSGAFAQSPTASSDEVHVDVTYEI